MKINEKIKLRHEELGLTLREISDYVGVSEATIQRYETGEIKNLKQGIIEKLAKILNVTPSYLMGWEEKKSDPFESISKNFEGEKFSKDEQEEINNYIKFILAKRK